MESSVSDEKREQATVWITVTAEAMAAVHRKQPGNDMFGRIFKLGKYDFDDMRIFLHF